MANPGYPRARRLAETIKRVLGEWLEDQPADRRLGFVTITDVKVTGDLRHAKVYLTALDPDLVDGAPDPEDTFRTLTEATGEARTWVAQNVRLRYAPTLEFLEDDVARQGARIDQLLAGLDVGDPDAASPGTDQQQTLPADRPAAGERRPT